MDYNSFIGVTDFRMRCSLVVVEDILKHKRTDLNSVAKGYVGSSVRYFEGMANSLENLKLDKNGDYILPLEIMDMTNLIDGMSGRILEKKNIENIVFEISMLKNKFRQLRDVQREVYFSHGYLEFSQFVTEAKNIFPPLAKDKEFND